MLGGGVGWGGEIYELCWPRSVFGVCRVFVYMSK